MLSLPLLATGCYLGHLAEGQIRLLRARRSLDAVLADPTTPAELRAELELVGRVRTYAETLGLDVEGQYTSYVAWPGDRVITAVVAARPGELEPSGFWFPLMGRLPYKGYFDPERAGAEAESLRQRDFDVCVVPVPAYSTLGWFDDPVTAPMLRSGSGRAVETILHELVHATVYLGGDAADFSEGVATFIGEEASVRFYAAAGDAEGAAQRRSEVEEDHRLDTEILALRKAVQQLYDTTPPGSERDEQRGALESDARRRIAALPFATRDPALLAERMQLNDACLALAATYHADLPRYAALLDALGGDLERFVARLVEAADAEDPRADLLGS